MNGGMTVSLRNLELLRSLPDTDVKAFSLSRTTRGVIDDIEYLPSTKNKYETLLMNMLGFSAYLSFTAEKTVLDHIVSEEYDIIYLDTSNFGRLAKKIKKISQARIVVFFHNVEVVYAKESVRLDGIQYLPMVLSNYLNEKWATRYGDVFVAINERDKEIIEKIYKKRVSEVLSVWYPDRPFIEDTRGLSSPLNVLFLGSYFHANVAGISWFIDLVLPLADIKLTIAGRGMEQLLNKYNESAKLEILGTVDDIESLYEEADCVVAPIFDGSGMKVKTGEAFRFGKTVVGTKEAFEGYGVTHGKEGYYCSSVSDFTETFDTINNILHTKTNIDSWNLFQNQLSKGAALLRLQALMNR